MVIRWSIKSLILFPFFFLLLPPKGYAGPKVDQEQYKKYISYELDKIKQNEHWKGLEKSNQDAVINESFFKNNEIKLPPENLEKQINLQGEKRNEFINKYLIENSAQGTPIQLSTVTLNDQYNHLAEPEQFLNDLLKANSTKKTKVRLTPEILKYQYELLDNRENFLKARLNDEYTDTQRQELINSLLKSYTNKELLKNPSLKKCTEVGVNGDPTYIGATHVIDWLNTAHFKGFFQPTMTYALVNGDTFNEFDTFNQWNLWVEPFGFYTQFNRDIRPLKFNMYTAGISAGGEYTIFDRLVLGLGVAYSHSGVNWQEDGSSANINSIYFGPSLSYVFSHGYLSCTIFGVGNFYQASRETKLFPELPDKVLKPSKTTPEYTSWDIVGRLEGGLSYEVGGHFFLYPTAKVDYLQVLEQASVEKLDDEVEISIGAFDGSFLNGKIGIKATREFFYESTGYLIPSLSAGFIHFTPLSNKSYQYEIDECEKFQKKLKVESWNQSYIGAGFAFLHKKAMLVSLDYELFVGAESPLHLVNLKIEWSW